MSRHPSVICAVVTSNTSINLHVKSSRLRNSQVAPSCRHPMDLRAPSSSFTPKSSPTTQREMKRVLETEDIRSCPDCVADNHDIIHPRNNGQRFKDSATQPPGSLEDLLKKPRPSYLRNQAGHIPFVIPNLTSPVTLLCHRRQRRNYRMRSKTSKRVLRNSDRMLELEEATPAPSKLPCKTQCCEASCTSSTW